MQYLIQTRDSRHHQKQGNVFIDPHSSVYVVELLTTISKGSKYAKMGKLDRYA